MDFKWTDEADALLKSMWGVASHQVIAGAIKTECGVDLSRSAVGGRAYRIGLPKFCVPNPPKPDKPKAVRRGPVNFNTMRSGPSLEAMPLPKEQVTDAPPEKRVKLIDLKYDGCRFYLGNVGEPGAGFCPETGYPYCPEHTRRCSQPKYLR